MWKRREFFLSSNWKGKIKMPPVLCPSGWSGPPFGFPTCGRSSSSSPTRPKIVVPCVCLFYYCDSSYAGEAPVLYIWPSSQTPCVLFFFLFSSSSSRLFMKCTLHRLLLLRTTIKHTVYSVAHNRNWSSFHGDRPSVPPLAVDPICPHC